MPEFAFDVMLKAVARVDAKDEKDAKRLLAKELDCADVAKKIDKVTITECSLDEIEGRFEPNDEDFDEGEDDEEEEDDFEFDDADEDDEEDFDEDEEEA